MERSHALVYVVDLSDPAPCQWESWDELRMLQEELEKYKLGMGKRARMAIADKAGLLASDGDPEDVRMARAARAVHKGRRWIMTAGYTMLYRPLVSTAKICVAWCGNCGYIWKRQD